MTILKMKAHLVNTIESEAGWGSKIDSQYLFPSEDLALAFCKEYNSKSNNKDVTPSIYWRQDYEGIVEVTEQQFNKFKYTDDLVIMPEWFFNGA